MAFYAEHILPRILDLAMRNPQAARLRAAWVPRAKGCVLEVGIGSGLNLPFYSPAVQRVYGVEPSRKLQALARDRAETGPLPVQLYLQSAEAPLPLADDSIDTAVSTWTLCSIPDAVAALRQVRRVLKPGGEFILIEHGYAPESGIARWQDRLTPCWKCICGGCHLNRKIDALVQSAGFEFLELKMEYVRGPRFATYTYEAVAKKASVTPD